MSSRVLAERHSGAVEPLGRALASCRGAFLGIALFSGIINLLMLAGSLYMLEVYDRILPSRSVPTLVGLSILVVLLFVFQGLFDVVRGRIMLRITGVLDEDVSRAMFGSIISLPLQNAATADGLQPMRDFDQIRSFLSSPGPLALFDLPWIPVYLGLCFVFHFWIGMTALVGGLVLVAMTVTIDLLTRRPTQSAARAGAARIGIGDAARRCAETIHVLGMRSNFHHVWDDANAQYRRSHAQTSEITGGLGSLSRSFRLALQSAVLGVGAYLVLRQEATAGIIIAGSILTGRALAPVDSAIAHWKGFVAARQSWARLRGTLAAALRKPAPMPLPAPFKSLAVEAASGGPPGIGLLTTTDVSFALEAGQGIGIIGPSASGKSSLVRMMVGAWQPARGRVRLDGAALTQWDPEALGAHIGYLPQDVELFAGTVAQNISRFTPDAPPQAVIEAAQAAAVHELILRLPDGYETQVGDRGSALSAGQRQRIALARALYGDPFLVVLDEPNSNLDAEGDEALTAAVLGVRARGGIAVVVAHRPSALAGVDRVLIMANGRAQRIGPKDQIFETARQAPGRAPAGVYSIELKTAREA